MSIVIACHCYSLKAEYLVLWIHGIQSVLHYTGRSQYPSTTNIIQARARLALPRLLSIWSIVDFHLVQHILEWPCKAVRLVSGFSVFDSDKIFHDSHTDIRADTSEDVPPAMQLENETPRQTNIMLECCDVAA